MNKAEAKANQDRIALNYNLGWWYGTHCEKCCGVYPKLMNTNDLLNCYYECEVCHKRTEPKSMPWLAERDWNNHKFLTRQADMFSYLEEEKND